MASLSKDDTTPVNDSDHIMRDVSLSGIGDSFKEKSPLKDTITVENKYVNIWSGKLRFIVPQFNIFNKCFITIAVKILNIVR